MSVITDEILDKIMRYPVEYVAVCVTDDPENNRAIRSFEFEQGLVNLCNKRYLTQKEELFILF